MKRLLVFLLVLGAFPVFSLAQRTLILAQNNIRFSKQTCFFQGSGAAFPSSKLNEYWDSGKRITSMTYGDHGWFFMFSDNSGILNQRTYDAFDSFSEELFTDMQSSGYCLTDIAKGPTSSGNKWCFVYSSYSRPYRQHYLIASDWQKIKIWLNEQWEDGFFVTCSYFDGVQWYFVTTEDEDFVDQSYLWANSYETLKAKITGTIWKNNKWVDNINYGPGGYLILYSRRRSQMSSSNQVYSVDPADAIATIKGYWNDGMAIQHIGTFLSAVENQTNPDTGSSLAVTKMTLSQKRSHNEFPSPAPMMDNGYNVDHQSIETLFGQVADINGMIYDGLYTMTGYAYTIDESFDIGYSPLMYVKIFFNKLIINGLEYPFVGWTNNSLRCYGTKEMMFTMTKDLCMDLRMERAGTTIVFGMTKGNLTSIFNGKRQTLSINSTEAINYFNKFSVSDSQNRKFLKDQWSLIERMAAKNIAKMNDDVFSFCLRYLAESQVKGLSK